MLHSPLYLLLCTVLLYTTLLCLNPLLIPQILLTQTPPAIDPALQPILLNLQLRLYNHIALLNVPPDNLHLLVEVPQCDLIALHLPRVPLHRSLKALPDEIGVSVNTLHFLQEVTLFRLVPVREELNRLLTILVLGLLSTFSQAGLRASKESLRLKPSRSKSPVLKDHIQITFSTISSASSPLLNYILLL